MVSGSQCGRTKRWTPQASSTRPQKPAPKPSSKVPPEKPRARSPSDPDKCLAIVSKNGEQTANSTNGGSSGVRARASSQTMGNHSALSAAAASSAKQAPYSQTANGG